MKIIKDKDKDKSSYHHTDLRTTLLTVASDMLKENGIKEVSLRKLGARVGVSRAAPYHHFKDKNALLCAIAEGGFKQLHQVYKNCFANTQVSPEENFRLYIHNYVQFAKSNPDLYELMFGRTIWKNESSTQELLDTAYPCFQFKLKMTEQWQEQGIFNVNNNALRASQVLWGTVHGIAKLFIDGIYTDNYKIEEICDYAVNMFLSGSQ